eukprot:1715028-Prymnesium_polylepis.1
MAHMHRAGGAQRRRLCALWSASARARPHHLGAPQSEARKRKPIGSPPAQSWSPCGPVSRAAAQGEGAQQHKQEHSRSPLAGAVQRRPATSPNQRRSSWCGLAVRPVGRRARWLAVAQAFALARRSRVARASLARRSRVAR